MAPLVLSEHSSRLVVLAGTCVGGKFGGLERVPQAPRALRIALAAEQRRLAWCWRAPPNRKHKGSRLESYEQIRLDTVSYMNYVGAGGAGCAGGSYCGLILLLAIFGAAFLMSTLFPFIL